MYFFLTKIIVRKSLNKEKLLPEVVAQAHCLGKIDYFQ